jgi:hypothetical protein
VTCELPNLRAEQAQHGEEAGATAIRPVANGRASCASSPLTSVHRRGPLVPALR